MQVVHVWVPCHREAIRRSHVDKTIVLLKLGERYVPIVESAVKYVEVNKNSQENVTGSGEDLQRQEGQNTEQS